MAVKPRILINQEIEKKIKAQLKLRREIFSANATKDSDSSRRKDDEKSEDFLRLPYSRDADRIIHSKAYSRYIDKTQVFFLVDNDHITHRVLHVQLVSKIARTIGRALGLNEDLIEAISLGHDIGHVPYGHLGEMNLNNLCKKHGIGTFHHNIQAIQFLDKIERLNLTFQVLDGILCHDGEKHVWTLIPDNKIDEKSFEAKLSMSYQDKMKIIPSTFEGCVVRLADNIAYLGRDLQDAIELKLLTQENLNNFPKSFRKQFGVEIEDCPNINWIVLDSLIKDVINSSYESDKICFSESVAKCVTDLKQFNYDNIYENEKLTEDRPKINFMFEKVFDTYLDDFKKKKATSPIFKDMWELPWLKAEYKKEVEDTPEVLVRDYIAGMTDRYFDKKFLEIMSPKRRENFS